MSLPTESRHEMDRLFHDAWILVNPAARNGRAVEAIRALAMLQQRLGADWQVRVSMRAGHLEALAAEAAQANAPLLLVAGGDGAVHQAVNALMRLEPQRRPILGVLPCGTGNDFAKMLNLPMGLEDAMDALRSGRIAPADAVRAGGRWLINDIGMGLLAKAAKAYYSLPQPVPAPARYFAAALRAAAGGYKSSVRLLVDGQVRFEGAFSLLAISNGGWTGGRFHMNPNARIDDGRIDICVAKPLSRWQALKSLRPLTRGEHLALPAVETFSGAEARVESERIEALQIDGELYDFPANGLDIRIEPGALRAIYGAFA